MSVIGKKPFVNKIVDACSKEQTQQIINLMNHLGSPTLVALYGYDNLIGPANIGVNYVTLKMNQLLAQIVNGILVYIDDTHCGFFGITSNSDNIDEFEIDPVNKTYNKIRENLTVEELRQVCGDRLVEVGGNITVQADDIDSGSATEGQTLVADGQGGAVWGEAGESTKLYMHKVALGTNGEYKAILYTTEVTPFTINTLAKWLKDNGFTSRTDAKSLELNNQVMSVTTTQLFLETAIYSSDGINVIRFETIIKIVAGTGFSTISYNNGVSSLYSDVVIEL